MLINLKSWHYHLSHSCCCSCCVLDYWAVWNKVWQRAKVSTERADWTCWYDSGSLVDAICKASIEYMSWSMRSMGDLALSSLSSSTTQRSLGGHVPHHLMEWGGHLWGGRRMASKRLKVLQHSISLERSSPTVLVTMESMRSMYQVGVLYDEDVWDAAKK